MARRILISAVTAVTIGLVATLGQATPVSVAELAAYSSRSVPAVAGRTLVDHDGVVERPELNSAGPSSATPSSATPSSCALSDAALGSDGINAGGLTRWRRRGSTVDRCDRAARRNPTNRTTGPRRVVSRDQVSLGGCRYFLRHGTLDMDELALELAVSRATLYRVVHSRDRLLADVLWRLAEHALWRARKERTRYGVEGVLEVGRRFSGLLLDAKPLRTFLTTEPDVAARVLLTATGGVHHRAVQAQKEIFAEATPPGHVWLSGDLDSRAYLLVRIFESMLYADLLASRQPDRRLAEQAIRAVLPETPVTTEPAALPTYIH